VADLKPSDPAWARSWMSLDDLGQRQDGETAVRGFVVPGTPASTRKDIAAVLITALLQPVRLTSRCAEARSRRRGLLGPVLSAAAHHLVNATSTSGLGCSRREQFNDPTRSGCTRKGSPAMMRDDRWGTPLACTLRDRGRGAFVEQISSA